MCGEWHTGYANSVTIQFYVWINSVEVVVHIKAKALKVKFFLLLMVAATLDYDLVERNETYLNQIFFE